MIESDDVCSQTETVHIILEALYSARRIENRRYSIVELSGRGRLVKESINALYESAVGGTVVLKIQDMKFEDEGMLYENLELLEMFCCEARRHLRDVLTVICLPRQCQKIKKKIYDFYGEGTFVEIKDMVMYKDMVMKTFDRMAHDNNMESDQDLYRCIEATTARIVKRRFDEAKGGVLFIDEAYSLVDDRSGSYGDEAINTIVREMENKRDDVIVIFAGYPKKMERFLQTNPGLRSRIAYHVKFEDYNIDELCDIAKLLAKNKGFILSDGAILKIRTVMERTVQQSDFGNESYVRKIGFNVKLVDTDIN